jgi:pimeloyl-ACP methyl ester carboxylesterase
LASFEFAAVVLFYKPGRRRRPVRLSPRAFLARRRVIHWFLAQIFSDLRKILESYERYCCQQPGAFRAPLAFVSGLLNDGRAEAAYKRVTSPTLLVFRDAPRFSDPAAARALLAENKVLEVATIDGSGDLPQVERPDVTAAVVQAFLIS